MKSRNLVIVLVVSCFLLMIGTYAAAQEVNPVVPSGECPMGGEGKGKNSPGAHLKKELGLTDTQVEQLKSLHQKRRAEMMTRMKETETKIKAILTPDQQAQFDLNKERMKRRMKRRGGMQGGSGGMQGGPGGMQGGPLKARFSGMTLTETQKTKLKSLMEGEKTKMQSMKSQRENDMKSILTPEQYQKFEELKASRGKRGGQQGPGKGMRHGGKRFHQDSPSGNSI